MALPSSSEVIRVGDWKDNKKRCTVCPVINYLLLGSFTKILFLDLEVR
jgi:hypothetical protein